MSQCKSCEKDLTGNEIGLTKKLINRGSTEFYCINCLAQKFNCDVPLLEKKIEQFKKQGCTLFT